MKLTQAEIEATVKETLDRRCFEILQHVGCVRVPCSQCSINDFLSHEIANALALKYLEKYRFVRPREATDSITDEQALAGLKVTELDSAEKEKHGS